MIALWGWPDGPQVAVRAALEKEGEEVLIIDPHRVLETAVHLEVGDSVTGSLDVGDKHVDLRAIRGVYVRPPSPTEIPVVVRAGVDSAAWRHALAVHEALRLFTELGDATVVNRMSAMASNGSKPYQARIIAQAGFAVPETLLTTDVEAARAFCRRHREVIYKSVSGVRSVVSRLEGAKLDRLGFIQNCPTQLQRMVLGDDHRVHVIGEHVHVTRIVSDAVDYRYAGREGRSLEMATAKLPKAEETRCRALARTLDLPVAGIDLRHSPDGRWFCFEVNPSPAFTFYERADDGPVMATHLAQLLAKQPKSRRKS